MPDLDVTRLGQVFTPAQVVDCMLGLCRNSGRVLEPSAGDGAFLRELQARGRDCTGIEIDARVAPEGSLVRDFFSYPLKEQFDTIIGNPPYVRFQDIPARTRRRLKSPLFDGRSNLFLFFIEKCVRHLKPGGELVFIVPREFIKLTAAKKLNAWLYSQGSITDFLETGDSSIFGPYVPNCAIFRFEKGRMERTLHDGRRFTQVDGQLMFLREDYSLPLARLFEVRVGGVSGADDIFTHPEGNLEFVCSRTVDSGETRRMIYGLRHPHLEAHKERLLARRVRTFDEENWWHWGRAYPLNERPRIYVNGRTRRPEPFFLHDSPHFDGSILALFPTNPALSRRDLIQAVVMLNREVNWEELGFVCDGRFLFTQRSLQTCLLPGSFSRFLAKED
ncbi:Eco57I restriction-modification methylase domain-containing protein [Azovibrio restrictus]|uniref:Eco57I restriction-modification methylase domain-containing protein n=1 Tax=Azovibrio restrictus TaxID=146938 RepID=UPI00047C1C19|nr:class I SAM-dependent methyltransferase [Azovibrio restrictus]